LAFACDALGIKCIVKVQAGMARLSASCISEALCVNPEFFRLAGVYT